VAEGSRSKIVMVREAREGRDLRSKRARVRPAGPAPIMAMEGGVGIVW
jgi:hypothetical protein